MLYDSPEDKIKTICYNISGVSPARTAKELELAVKKFIPEAKITFKPDPEFMKFSGEFFTNMGICDDSRVREEWGWKPMYTDLEKLVKDFIREVRTRPQLYETA